jgi:monomeric isocitrate dehydrogenase
MSEYTVQAPMLATYSLLPIIQRFAKPMGVEVRLWSALKSYNKEKRYPGET